MANGASFFIRPCTPDVLDDILLAPSYPWPRMFVTGTLFSFRKARMFSAIFSPVILSSLINVKNSSLTSSHRRTEHK